MATKKQNLVIVREFNAPKALVFEAFSDAGALAEWWGPVDFPTSVVKFDFRPKGIFHYKMETPHGAMWAKFEYIKIEEPDLLEFIISFSDEQGGIARAPFAPTWPLKVYHTTTFTEKNGKTILTMIGSPINPTDEEYATFLDMQPSAFKGYNATFDTLDRYLSARFKLRGEAATSPLPRTCTYLNFSGNTEEAFNFYRSVFGGDFNGKGIQRFGDIPAEAGHPPVDDKVKKMILHVELPILGGHVLMGTDAPEEMGFTLNFGNNSHICLEPVSRSEAKNLFDALSVDGVIDMPLQDMFFGAYFGSFSDKFGVNWMVNCITK